jgi:hypothetical protein
MNGGGDDISELWLRQFRFGVRSELSLQARHTFRHEDPQLLPKLFMTCELAPSVLQLCPVSG